ncbi:hypothetical protein NPIL_198541 [Nephila pilipes]|uniref:Uncharacterized protein n=1 Tax=Nephila pilipes TaxID=299642 RepID=A0A8X6Q0U5_NEPPI|nr:hypothetical protein NPIL_198541 [Nephila pilipes]
MESLTVLKEGSCFPANEKNVRHRKSISLDLIGRRRERAITVNETNSRCVIRRRETMEKLLQFYSSKHGDKVSNITINAFVSSKGCLPIHLSGDFEFSFSV